MREWVVGRNPVRETIRAGRRHIFQLYVAEGIKETATTLEAMKILGEKSIPVKHIRRDELDSLGPNHQGLALQVGAYPYFGLNQILSNAGSRNEPPFILILDSLQDPQNLGTLLRTAEAVGVHGIIIPQNNSAKITPAVVSASSGACEHLTIVQANLVASMRELKEHNIWILGLANDPNGTTPAATNFGGGIGLVVGSEGEGMRRLVAESCDLILRLPMVGKIESLNAAVAGSIALYLIYQARSAISGAI